MHQGPDAYACQDVEYHAAQYADGIAYDSRKAFAQRYGVTLCAVVGGLCSLQLPHPFGEQPFEAHMPEQEAAYGAEYDAARHIYYGCAQAERPEEHGYGHLVHQRRGYQERECHAERYAAAHEADEERYRRAGAEGRDGPEERCQQVLRPEEAARGDGLPQPFDGHVGVDDAHQRAYEQQQEDDLYGVVDEEVERRAPVCGGVEAQKRVCDYVREALYHGSAYESCYGICYARYDEYGGDDARKPPFDGRQTVVEVSEAVGAVGKHPCRGDDG